MSEQTVQSTVEQAVGQAFDRWSAEHPSLAAVIDHITLTERAVESLRDSDEYRQAVAAYHRGMSETDLLNKLLDLAGPVISSLLAG